ncbi:DUF6928 family protein [Streptomyces sp. NBC_01340]|uniref:DUF6928 family protein n=1 Tax=Streptomyces sp. NBC_01340 TaxID=2903830 RepID=UPI003DA56FE6
MPHWAGDRPADVVPWPDEDEEPYPLPFHPLELGEDAPRALRLRQETMGPPLCVAA